MSTALITQSQEAEIIAIDDIAKETQAALTRAEATGSQTLKALVLAKGMQALRKHLSDDLLKEIMELQGSPLGFRTDKDSEKGYPINVIRDVTLEATLRGFRMIGNEVNIIAGRLYPTKEGFERVVKEWPGLADLEIEVEVPEFVTKLEEKKTKEGKTYTKEVTYGYCSCSARFTLNGRPMEIVRSKTDKRDLRIVVSVHGEAHDAAIGKCKSKLYRLIHERISGYKSESLDDEPAADEIEADTVEPNDTSLNAWGKSEQDLREAIDACTDREQLERVYKNWQAYAGKDPEKARQLVNACTVKASTL